jgi:glycosyltransferase involved in cell wall biosynthesis
MRSVAQIAFSGLSGASDLCAALAIAGQKAGVPQKVAFWGTEPLIEARRERCEGAGVSTVYLPKKQGLDPASQRELQTWAGQQREAQAVIMHYPAGLFALRKAFRGLKSRPAILALEHHPNQLKRPHEWLLSVLLLWLGDGVVYNTETYRSEVERKLGPLFNLRRGKTTIITNGIELGRYQATPAPKPTGEFRIGMSGRMAEVKDYKTLLRAFAGLQIGQPNCNLRLELAGDGPMRAELEALAGELGISDLVNFLGLMPFNDLLPRMRSWDVFVLSTFGETQPLALMEAMACGLPCLGTAVPGVLDVVEPGKNGLLVDAADVRQMTAELARLVAEADLRQALGAGALDYAQRKFSSSTMWNNFQKFIELISK